MTLELLVAAAVFVILAMVFTVRLENRADRRDEEEASAEAIKSAARQLAPPEGAVQPAEPTYWVRGSTSTYADGGNWDAPVLPTDTLGRTQA